METKKEKNMTEQEKREHYIALQDEIIKRGFNYAKERIEYADYAVTFIEEFLNMVNEPEFVEIYDNASDKVREKMMDMECWAISMVETYYGED